MYPYDPDERRSNCPECGEAIRRIPRSVADRGGRFATAMRRYQCTGAGCSWQGLLPRQPGQRRSRALSVIANAQVKAGLRRVAPVALSSLAGAALAVLTLVSFSPSWLTQARAPTPLPPGAHHEGVSLNPQHPLLKAQDSAAPEVQRLALRQGCVWGKPGTNPYRGTPEEALVTARLPAEVVERIAMKVKAGQVDDRLEITNAGIRTQRDEREFEPRNVALTYGKTLCVNARVNFKAGHVERASLYEAADKRGNLYSVMVPDVCGNVSVLGARMERGRKRVALAVLAETAHGAPALLLAADNDDPAVHAVPEPGTLACVLAGLAGVGAAGWWSRRRSRQSANDAAR